MLMRSSTQEKLSGDLQKIAQAKAAADNALTRVKYFFHQYPHLLLSTPKDWEKYINSPYSSEAQKFERTTRLCQPDNEWSKTKKRILEYAQGGYMKLTNASFQLVNLSHKDNNRAVITVRAKTSNGSTSNLQADILFNFAYLDAQADVPALWVQQGGTGRSEFYGDVWFNDCDSNIERVRLPDSNFKAKYVAYQFPDLPDLNEISFRLPTSHKLALNDQQEDNMFQFPRPGDEPTQQQKGGKLYEYIITEINTNKPIEINSVVNGEPVFVVLHTIKNVNQAKIIHRCGTSTDCPPERLIILGYEGSQMCFVTDKLNAFIFAPNYGVGFKRNKINQPPLILGSLWLKELTTDRVCGEDVRITQRLQWLNVLMDFQILSPYPQILKISQVKKIENSELEFNSLPEPPILPPIPQGGRPIFIDQDFTDEELMSP
ncbi:MAG: hypothetical protein WBM32_11660 [Crocosphaera sp.]